MFNSPARRPASSPRWTSAYFIAAIRLPPGATLERTDQVVRKAADLLLKRPGVDHAVAFAGFDGATFTNAPNAGVIFVTLKPFDQRVKAGLATATILNDLRGQTAVARRSLRAWSSRRRRCAASATGGGFKMIRPGPRRPRPARARAGGRRRSSARGQPDARPGPASSPCSTRCTPQIYADIDRTKAEMLGVPTRAFSTRFRPIWARPSSTTSTILGRTYRVTAQADNPFRSRVRDVQNLQHPLERRATWCRSARSRPSATITGPYRVPRYNLFPAAEVQGRPCPASPPARRSPRWRASWPPSLPAGFGFEWTELAYQEKIAGNTAVVVFASRWCSSSCCWRRNTKA